MVVQTELNRISSAAHRFAVGSFWVRERIWVLMQCEYILVRRIHHLYSKTDVAFCQQIDPTLFFYHRSVLIGEFPIIGYTILYSRLNLIQIRCSKVNQRVVLTVNVLNIP